MDGHGILGIGQWHAVRPLALSVPTKQRANNNSSIPSERAILHKMCKNNNFARDRDRDRGRHARQADMSNGP